MVSPALVLTGKNRCLWGFMCDPFALVKPTPLRDLVAVTLAHHLWEHIVNRTAIRIELSRYSLSRK